MEAWMAFVSIIAIVAIVVVAGGLIAFIAHMIMGVFGNGTKTQKNNKELLDYAQYKQLTSGSEVTENKEYDFDAINERKAQEEKKLLEKESVDIFNIDRDEELEEIENRLKAAEKTEEAVEEESIEEVKEETAQEEDELDEIDFDNMLNEISNDVIEDEKAQADSGVKMSEELESYSIDELLKQVQEDSLEELEEDEEPVEEATEIEEISFLLSIMSRKHEYLAFLAASSIPILQSLAILGASIRADMNSTPSDSQNARENASSLSASAPLII